MNLNNWHNVHINMKLIEYFVENSTSKVKYKKYILSFK